MDNDWWQPQAFGVNTGNAYITGMRQDPHANPGVLSTLYQQPAQFAGVLGQNYQNYSQGLAGLGNAYTNAYGAYNFGLGNVATARSNEASARYGANAMAEAARQASLGNIGSAALGAYGGASNNALAAWAQNQQAYNNAAASMHNANQQGISQYGQSRNAALGSLGNAYGGIGRAQMASDALSNINIGGNFGGIGGGGGGFSATGPSGSVASGSYGGGLGLGGGGFSLTGSSSRSSRSGGESGGALAGLGGLQNNLMAGDVMGSLERNADAGRAQLDAQHYSSRMMPSQMLNQTLGGLLSLGSQAYGASSGGMDQFYANTQMDERPYQGILDRMTAGYGTVGGQLGGVQNDLRTGYGTANTAVRNLWDDSLGRTAVFSTPADRLRRDREATELRRRYDAEDSAWRDLQAAEQYRNSPYASHSPYLADRARRTMEGYRTNRQFMGGYA